MYTVEDDEKNLTFLYTDDAVFKLYSFIHKYVLEYGKSKYANSNYQEMKQLLSIISNKEIINRCLKAYKDPKELKENDIDLFNDLVKIGCKLQELKKTDLEQMPEQLFFETDNVGNRKIIYFKPKTRQVYNSEKKKFETEFIGYEKKDFTYITPLEIDLLNLAQYFVREVRGVKMYKNKYNQFISDLHNDKNEPNCVTIDVIDANNIICADTNIIQDKQIEYKNYSNIKKIEAYSKDNAILSPVIHDGNGKNNLNAVKRHYEYVASVIVKNFINKVNSRTGCCDYLVVPGTGVWGNTNSEIIDAYRNACINYLGEKKGKEFFNSRILFCCHSNTVDIKNYSYNCFATKSNGKSISYRYDEFFNTGTSQSIDLKDKKMTFVNAGDPLMQIAGEGMGAQLDSKQWLYSNYSFDTLFASTNYHQVAGTAKSGKYKLCCYTNKDNKIKSIITIFDESDSILFKNNRISITNFNTVNVNDINLNPKQFEQQNSKNNIIPVINIDNFIQLNDSKENCNDKKYQNSQKIDMNSNDNKINDISLLQKQLKQNQQQKIKEQQHFMEEKNMYIQLGKDIQTLSYTINHYLDLVKETFIINDYIENKVKNSIKEEILKSNEILPNSRIIQNLDLMLNNVINAIKDDYNSYKNKDKFFNGADRYFDAFKQMSMLPILLNSIEIYDDKYLDCIYEGIDKRAREKTFGEKYFVPLIICENQDYVKNKLKKNKRNDEYKKELHEYYEQFGQDIQTISSSINSEIYNLKNNFNSCNVIDFVKKIKENVEKDILSQIIKNKLESIIHSVLVVVRTDFVKYSKKYNGNDFFENSDGFNNCKKKLLSIYLNAIKDKRSYKYLDQICNGIKNKAQQQNGGYYSPWIICAGDIDEVKKNINSKNIGK